MAHPDQLAGRRPRAWRAVDDLVVVVEHAGWPRSGADEELALWKAGMRRPRRRSATSVVCKLSGLAMPLGSMSADAFAPVARARHRGCSASTGACSPATSPSTACTAPSTSCTPRYATVTAGLDDAVPRPAVRHQRRARLPLRELRAVRMHGTFLRRTVLVVLDLEDVASVAVHVHAVSRY